MNSMIVSGLGTKDSPILLDDDSESEVITELIGTPLHCLSHPERPDSTPRLSPRPGTFFSNVARLNLSKSSAQTLKKYRQGLRQQTHGLKRKRVSAPSEANGGPYPTRGQPNTENIVVEVVADSVKRESEIRHQLLNPPEKLSRSGVGPLAKKPKHTHEPNNEPLVSPDRLPLATLKESTTSKPSSALGPTSCPNAPWPIPKHSRFPDSTALPSPMNPTPYQFDPTPLPLPVTTPDLFNGQLMSMTQETFPVMNVDFDPMFWALSLSMNGFAMSSAPIPPIGIPPSPNPTVSQKQQSKLPLPFSKSSSSMISELASSISSSKSDTIISEHLPVRPPHSNEKSSIPRQKPFTLRPTDRPMTASAYLPIGKPDFRDIHGVFPIVPLLMFPAQSGTAVPYAPDLDRTLVLEDLPRSCTSSKVWIQNWCLKACGSLPEHFLVGPRRALVVFKQPEHAIDAWASPKLGMDESGFRIMGAVGESKHREDLITAYWYRPDVVMERQLLKNWTSSKKMVAEMKGMLAISMDESIVVKVLTERFEEMLELCLTQPQVETSEPRIVLQRMADERGYHRKLAEMIETALTEEDVLKWEQKEIALIERERTRYCLPLYRTKYTEVGKAGGDEERKTEGKKSTLRSHAQVFTPHLNQRNAPSTPTGGLAPTNAVAGPSSISKLPSVSSSSTLPARPPPLLQHQLSSSSSTSGSTPPKKPELRFGQPAWKEPDYMVYSTPKSHQTRIHPNHSASVNQSEQCASNLSASSTAGTSAKHSPALHSSPLSSTLPAKPRLPDIPSCDVTIPPLSSHGKAELRFGQTAWNLPTTYPTISSSTKKKPLLHTPPMFPARSIFGDRKDVAEPREQSQTVSNVGPAHISIPVGVDESPVVAVATTSKPQANESPSTTNPRISTARISPEPADSSGSVKPQLSMVSTSVPFATSESVSKSVSIPNLGKVVASTSTGTSASSSLASTTVMVAAPGFRQGASDRVQMSDIITDQSVAVKAESAAIPTPHLILVPAPRSPPVIPLRMLQQLKRVLAKSTEERQKFLDNEFKATRLLMDRLMTITCKTERKQVTDLWKQKIRIMDEVTRSIRNEAKVWYSQEVKTWIRMRWPDCLDTAGVLVIDDED